MKMRRILSILLAVVLMSGAFSARAYENFSYTGDLDPETGEPIENGTTASRQYVSLTDGVYYDSDNQGYVYTVGSTAKVLCSVVDGMVVQKSVRIVPDDGLEITLYRNGEAVEQPDLTNISDIGDYVVETTVNSQTYQVLSFSIIGDVTNSMAGYTMPDGFTITEVTLDDMDIYDDRGYISMTEEGHYVINYRCVGSGMSYKLDVTVDTTPPEITISGLNEKNQARGPVTISNVEEGAGVVVMLDGTKTTYKSELTESGEYQIYVTDAAGNVAMYAFTILVYFDLNSWLFLGIAVAALVSVGVYIIISRKKLAVR